MNLSTPLSLTSPAEMIQRIQTLMLIGAALMHVLLFFVPIWTNSSGSEELRSIIGVTENSPLMIINLAIIAGLIACIFLYRNRMRQLQFSRLLILIISGFVAYLFIAVEQSKDKLGVSDASELSNYGFGAVLPVISLILVLMAGRFIWKDEQLVRSADRLR